MFSFYQSCWAVFIFHQKRFLLRSFKQVLIKVGFNWITAGTHTDRNRQKQTQTQETEKNIYYLLRRFFLTPLNTSQGWFLLLFFKHLITNIIIKSLHINRFKGFTYCLHLCPLDILETDMLCKVPCRPQVGLSASPRVLNLL